MAGDVVGEEIEGDDDGDGVDGGEVPWLALVLCDGGIDFAEEEDGGEADGAGDDGEHEEEGGGAVGEEGGADVGEDGGGEANVALEDAGDRASVLPEVSDAGDQHRSVHPCRAVASQS